MHQVSRDEDKLPEESRTKNGTKETGTLKREFDKVLREEAKVETHKSSG